MKSIQSLLDHNREWAAQIEKDEPGFFGRLAKQQAPEFLWIGCSDSRVPANQIIGLMPGEVFVHRNVANVVSLDDPNCMSVVDYAVVTLRVKHIIVCGHYGCGGVLAAMEGLSEGTIGGWLSSIRELHQVHAEEFDALDSTEAGQLMCELNVRQQVQTLCQSETLRGVWAEGQELAVHAWIYGLEDGLLSNLQAPVSAPPGN